MSLASVRDAAVREAREWRDEPMKRVAARGRVIEPWRRARFARFGRRSVIDRPVWLYGTEHMAVGDGTVVLRGGWLAVERQAWSRPDATLVIGDRVWMRPYCVVSAAESIVIEDDVVISAFSTLIDSDHTYRNDVDNVLWNPIETTPIRVGRGTWIGERVAVLRGSDIGTRCIIGSNSVVRGSIPDYSIAVGAPARVVGSTRDAATA